MSISRAVGEERRSVDAYVIVATKGRPREVAALVTALARQTLAPRGVIVVGASPADVAGLVASDRLHVVLSARPGLTIQRNAGLHHLADRAGFAAGGDYFVVFFDDDFRPADDWLERCRDAFAAPGVVGLTGRVLADGAQGIVVTDADAEAYIAGTRPPEPHWASGDAVAEVRCAYGCNMAFRECVVARCRFDENLPLYGWQEDQDFTTLARALGRVVYFPSCRGVHLGTKTGRVSGLRFGYSQIANPLYLMRKGTMGIRKGSRFLFKAPIANGVKSVVRRAQADYPGRLRGNVMALADLVRRKCHPLRVLEFG